MHVHKRLEMRANPHFQKIQFFFLLKINIFFYVLDRFDALNLKMIFKK